jgi:hypothetical protein
MNGFIGTIIAIITINTRYYYNYNKTFIEGLIVAWLVRIDTVGRAPGGLLLAAGLPGRDDVSPLMARYHDFADLGAATRQTALPNELRVYCPSAYGGRTGNGVQTGPHPEAFRKCPKPSHLLSQIFYKTFTEL